MSELITYAIEAIKVGLKIYAMAGGGPIDLEQLAGECGVEVLRIDTVQAADEAAENKAAGA